MGIGAGQPHHGLAAQNGVVGQHAAVLVRQSGIEGSSDHRKGGEGAQVIILLGLLDRPGSGVHSLGGLPHGGAGAVLGIAAHGDADGVNARKAAAGLDGVVDGLLQAHGIQQLLPAGIVEGSADHICELQLGGLVKLDFRQSSSAVGILLGAVLDDVAAVMLQHQLGCGQAFIGLGEGADPILTGQHGDGTGLVIVPVGVIQLVGDFLTRAGHAEGVGIHGAVGGGVVGPLPGSLGVAVVSHAVCGGLALSSQDVVHRVMRAIADGEVVLVAVLHDVGLGLHVVVAGQVLQIHIDDHGGAFAGLEHLGHVVVQQLHGRLLNQVITVILGVGSLTVDLHIGLARHLASVGNRHLSYHRLPDLKFRNSPVISPSAIRKAQCHRAILECSIRESVSKRIERLIIHIKVI